VHRLADLALVAVGRRGVDVAVPGVECARTASRVSSEGVWNTPRPSAGISTPLLRVTVSTYGTPRQSFGFMNCANVVITTTAEGVVWN
jgi:hypothetical protein